MTSDKKERKQIQKEWEKIYINTPRDKYDTRYKGSKKTEQYQAMWDEVEKPNNNYINKPKKKHIITKIILLLCIIYELFTIFSFIEGAATEQEAIIAYNVLIIINVIITIFLIKYWKKL